MKYLKIYLSKNTQFLEVKTVFFTTENLSKYADDIGSEKIFDENGLHGTISEDVKVHKLLHKVIEEKF